jgi:hypothetical protein
LEPAAQTGEFRQALACAAGFDPGRIIEDLMRYTLRSKMLGLALALLSTAAGNVSLGDTPAAAIGPYVNDDTVVAAYFDLTALSKTEKGDSNSIFAVLPFLDDDAAAALLVLQGLDQLGRDLHAAGVDRVYAIAGLADANEKGGPVLVFPVRQGKAAKDVIALLSSLKAQPGLRRWAMETRESDGNVVLVGTSKTLDRYTAFAKSERGDFAGALDNLSQDGAVLAAVFCPGSDFRRVVRELWPELPGALASLKGELADRWRYLAVGAAPGSAPRIAVQASDAESAAAFATLWSNLPDTLEIAGQSADWQREGKAFLRPIVDEVQPRIDGTRVTLDFNVTEPQLTALRNAASEAAHAMTESSRRNERLNHFKHLLIAMQNYHDVHKRLPASASVRDKNGKPLLSWRVAILPYIDEEKLYKQFHLDEPWDSPHNRTLIAKMPEVFADPDRKLSKLAGEGKTTYQVPVAPDTAFDDGEGRSLRDITDGTSKTILVVEVEPSRAVEWTKPHDWEVDIQNPLEGVARSDRIVFSAGFADAHVELIPVDVDFKKLRGLLTRSGGEVFDWP